MQYFLHLIDAGVSSTFACIVYFNYYTIIVISLVVIYVRGPMKLINLKEFVVL